MALGKPVISSRIGGLPEQIEDSMNGMLFEPGNAESLAAKISLMTSKPRLAQELGRNARETVERKYSMNQYYEKTISLYNSLTKSSW
jgi:glycosyltransferase involved in cell wall biosynthesis